MRDDAATPDYKARRALLLATLGLAAAALLWRIVDLQVLRKDFLQDQGDARHLRVVTIAAHRGVVTDRHGEPLAVSTPVDSVWANPQELTMDRVQRSRLVKLLGMDTDQLQRVLARGEDREFVYLRRRIHPELAQRVTALDIPGVSLQREYRRYYPTGEVTAHVIGFTNVDDMGQEGIELAYDEWLRGVSGSKRVIKDRLGRVVENVESIEAPKPGRELALSIDRRVQYIAYRELKAVVQRHDAVSGSVVVLDAKTGEVLAMANQPSYNPNNRAGLRSALYRNRAVTDVFEPGSTIKPFSVAAALLSGMYRPDSFVDTAPGFLQVGKDTVRDIRNYGTIDVATVIEKSSNVGVSKLALSLPPGRLWEVFSRVGFGAPTASGFPGESTGFLSDYRAWRDIERATLSFGYGLSVTALQLAQAYAVLAADGRLRPVTFLRVDAPPGPKVAPGTPVLARSTVRELRKMLETAVGAGGTGRPAAIAGYRVAGKTGTVRKSGIGGYQEDRYLSLFAGMAPADRPRLVMVVVINEPRNGKYYGGQVAAPVFSNVMSGALRLMNVAPDAYAPSSVYTIADGAAGGRGRAKPASRGSL